MKSFEELMNIPQNRDRFLFLKQALKCNRLICFFGAGLSLGSKSKCWGYPFEWTICRLNRHLDVLKNDVAFHGRDSEVCEIIEDIAKTISEATDCSHKNEFLEAGDLLNEAIKKLKANLHRRGFKIEFDSINDACVSAFDNDTYQEVNDHCIDSPYIIPAILFLPFLSKYLITTNVERSFEKVVSVLEQDRWHRNVITPLDQVVEWQEDSYSIFYLHGHISQPNTLVMAKSDYDRMYPESIPAYDIGYGARKLLGAAVRGYTILFVGSSLQQDRTVDVINFEARHGDRNQLHLIPLVEEDNNGEIIKLPQIEEQEPIRFSSNCFDEISTILLQLIRETAQNWTYCSWQETGNNGNENRVPENVKIDICNSLTSTKPFDQVDIAEKIEINDLINYLYSHYSMACHDDGLGWSICCISENHFSLDGIFPLHNYPLGDTIYVLAGGKVDEYGNSPLYHDRANKIAKDIMSWRMHSFPDFSGSKGQTKTGCFMPRVRVIMMPFLPKSRKETDQEVQKIIAQINSRLKALSTEKTQNDRSTDIEELIQLFIPLRRHYQIPDPNINDEIISTKSRTLKLLPERKNNEQSV